MDLRPSTIRPHLCTVIDFANARAARAVGLPTQSHAFQVADPVVLADGAEGRILEFKGNFALVQLTGPAGAAVGIKRAAALSCMRKVNA